MGDEVVKTVGAMLAVVRPALAEILTEQELAATTTRVLRQPDDAAAVPALADRPVLSAEDLLDDDTLLEVLTFDDRCGSWMQGRENPGEMFARFRSELQDFVAESGFGWGQFRR